MVCLNSLRNITVFSFIRCGPCCAFTPKLIKFYKKHAEEKNLEIIFIGSDEDEESFNEYYKKMPWLKLDFQERKKAEELETKFKVNGIPRLVLLDGDSGDLITDDGRNQIEEEDPEGENFPWKEDE
jgi:thiol-disulfide isomerase/thioredoxin